MLSISKFFTICHGKPDAAKEPLLPRPEKEVDTFSNAPPSYMKRMMKGVPDLEPRERFRSVTDLPPDKLIDNAYNRVDHFFNDQYGCTPEQYRVGMARRRFNYSGCGECRMGLVYDFPYWLHAERAVAMMLLRQILTPTFKDRLDMESTHLALINAVVPALLNFSRYRWAFIGNAMHNLIEVLAIVEREVGDHVESIPKIKEIKRALLGGEIQDVRFSNECKQQQQQQQYSSAEPPPPYQSIEA